MLLGNQAAVATLVCYLEQRAWLQFTHGDMLSSGQAVPVHPLHIDSYRPLRCLTSRNAAPQNRCRLESIAQTTTKNSGFEVTTDRTASLKSKWAPVDASVAVVGPFHGRVTLATKGMTVGGIRYVRSPSSTEAQGKPMFD